MSAKKKQKQISIKEYIETYCQEKRIRGRFAVYVSPEVHDNLKRIARLFNYKHHSTTSSLADSIISHHIDTYRELLNNAAKEDTDAFFEWLKKARQSESEETESYEEDE
jgi:type III secretory pathway component EscR